MMLPPNAHGAQWETVVEGEIEFTIGGVTKYTALVTAIRSTPGAEHGAMIKAGTRGGDVVSEPDGYPIKG